MRQEELLQRENRTFARRLWGSQLDALKLTALEAMTAQYGFRVASGDLILLDGNWYVTHTGLLSLARRSRCLGIRVQQIVRFCDVATGQWTFKATVYKSSRCRGFVGYGDASPSNVSFLVRGAEMRVAETRAVNRALRKAYGIGICSVEELGSPSRPIPSPSSAKRSPVSASGGNGAGNGNGQPRLRDLLCLLIRQHHLDASLVKRYATEFCGVTNLRQATREQVEALVKHLGDFAAKDPAGLTTKLNSYTDKQEGAGAA